MELGNKDTFNNSLERYYFGVWRNFLFLILFISFKLNKLAINVFQALWSVTTTYFRGDQVLLNRTNESWTDLTILKSLLSLCKNSVYYFFCTFLLMSFIIPEISSHWNCGKNFIDLQRSDILKSKGLTILFCNY